MSDDGVPAWHGLPPNPWNPHCWVVGEPEVGEGCWIGAFCLLDGSGGLRIGTGTHVSAGAQLYTHTTVRAAVTAGEAPIERAPTSIGAHVHVGAGAIVLMGATIGDHSVVAAGAVVAQFTEAPPWSLLVGTPARVVADGARRFAEAGPPAGEP